METDETTPNTTAGKTKFYQGEGQTAPLFCIEPGISCQHASPSQVAGRSR